MIFHGWINIQVDDKDDPDFKTLTLRMDEALIKLKKKVEEVDDSFCHFQVGKAGNDMNFLNVHGNRNHRFRPVIELFHWVAENLQESYGLLYVWDDEHKDFDNEYRVYKVAQGKCTEHKDHYLSPCVPTIEKPYHWEEKDT
jgi:hypothetical protein